MGLDLNQKPNNPENYVDMEAGRLALKSTDLVIDVSYIDQFENNEYAMIRKGGLGASDSSTILGVNPYTNRNDLIAEKCRTRLTQEELAIGQLTAVRKGRDLEPLIIDKFKRYFKQDIIKPIDMYRHKEYDFLKINYDGVTTTERIPAEFYLKNGMPPTDSPLVIPYIPAEIKVVTARGEKHYNPGKAYFNEITGFGAVPPDITGENWDIETKAAFIGIPGYYYTQVQAEIYGLNAPYGYLSVLFDKDWRFYTFFVWRDQRVINNLVIEGYKVWETILARRGPDWLERAGLGSILTAHSPDKTNQPDQEL